MEASSASTDHDPVNFAAPPVNEVVLSVQFESDVIDEVGALAKFWPLVAGEFPRHEKQPPLPPAMEDFRRPPESGVQFQMLQGPPSRRYWFLTEDGTSLIQVQGDRFALNWRQVVGTENYPRYRTLRPMFERLFTQFLDCVEPNENGIAAPSWCEVTYINHVPVQGSSPGTHGPLSTVLRALNPAPTAESLPPVEDSQLQQRFLITGPSASEPVGRLYLTATPAFRTADAAPIYVVSLLARGKPEPPSKQGVLAFFDRGRDLIVRGFKDSTTDEMHQAWGLEAE